MCTCVQPRTHPRFVRSSAWHATPFRTESTYGYKRKVTYLFVSLAEGALLERLTDIFTPAREKPGTVLGVVHDEHFARRRLDDNHARREEKVARPEVAVRDRRRRIFRVESARSSAHDLGAVTIVIGAADGSPLGAKWHRMRACVRACVRVWFGCGEKGTRKQGVKL